MTFAEMESKIHSIAIRSSSFKIGETGQEHYARLNQHPDKFRRIEVITWSKNKKEIDIAEAKMIEIFINRTNCANKKTGRAGKMGKSKKYMLYVIYVLKRK